jgi:hypothetical protein
MASGDAPSPKTAATSQHRISTVVVTFFFSFFFLFRLSFIINIFSRRLGFSFLFSSFSFVSLRF